LLHASSRLLYGGMQHNPPSRFLAEIPNSEVGILNFESTSSSSDFRLQTSVDEVHYVPELNEGDGVKHQVFGLGTVLEVEGDNATIYFKGKGTKKLNIAFAPLEKL